MNNTALSALAALALTTSLAAQGAPETPPPPNTVPQDVVDYVRAKGNTVDVSIASLYQSRQQQGDLPGVKKTPHQAYGTDPRQFVDVFAPATRPATPVPVVVFMHGGAFVGGSLSSPDSFTYDHLGKFFARNGYVFVNVEYRLAPAHPWPAGGEDMRGAVEWTLRHIGQFGGDPARIFVMGHSAGASHAAHYTFDTRVQANGGKDGVIGSILLSPVVSLEGMKGSPAYYGRDPTPDMASITHVNERSLPVFLGFAQYDPVFFQDDAARLFSALCARDRQCPAIKMLQQHSHISEIDHINTADDSAGSDILTFIRDVSTRGTGSQGR